MGNRLKVLQIVGIMNRGGAEAMLMDIFRQTHDKMEFVFLVNDHKNVLGRKGTYDQEILALGGKIRYIGTQGSLGPKEYIRQMRQIVVEEKPDLAHCHLNAKTGFIALALHKAGVKRIIAHCHADIRFHGNPLKNFINETEVYLQKFLISRYCTDFWGCSVEANRRLFRGEDFKKSVIINNAIDCQKYEVVAEAEWKAVRDSFNLPKDAIVLGNVGRIVPHKNIAFIVDLLAELKTRGTSAYMVVAGRNDAKEYVDNMLADAKSKGVDGQILLLGERSDIPEVMHTFDVFVGPSICEGFGLVAVEAQAAGVPCVLYKGFPKLTDMKLGLATYHEDFNVKEWCNDIQKFVCESKKLDKETICNNIRMLGFDSSANAETVMNLYGG